MFHPRKHLKRIAIATSRIDMKKEYIEMVTKGKHKKGDVLAIARIL